MHVPIVMTKEIFIKFWHKIRFYMKIPGSAYLVIGLAVAILSYIIDKDRFFLFVLIGCIFAFVGVIKVFSRAVKKKPAKSGAHPQQQQHQGQQRQAYQQSPQHPPHHYTHYVKFCPSCGQAVRNTDYFCSRCGTVLRTNQQNMR